MYKTNLSTLDKARQLIETVRGRKLSTKERGQFSIELAAAMIQESHRQETDEEKRIQRELGRMIEDSVGKIITMSLTDQCFRTENHWRTADQVQFLLNKFGIPQYLTPFKKFQLRLFKGIGKWFAPLLVPLFKMTIRKECSRFILPGEIDVLTKAIAKRQQNHLRINLNHLGEAILGEEDAERRLQTYLEDLQRPEIEYISIKVSTLCSQLNLIAWEETLAILTKRFENLLQAAYENKFVKPDGSKVPKFVNLDMEEFRDLDLTVELFKRTLQKPKSLKYSAGIVLQSYLPESYQIQQELTKWAMQRVSQGGVPIKIRIVKGANLAMEKVDASLHDWPQAPYTEKADVDANFKRMLSFACQKTHAEAANVGIASHNLFDIAYGILLRAENEVESEVCFEMLEGMADAQRRVVQELAGDMLLYCPAASKDEFQNAVAYLIRRLDENTSQENFLKCVFKLKEGTPDWNRQASLFLQACENSPQFESRRQQDRFFSEKVNRSSFKNEQDTDWSLSQNRKWAHKILEDWSQKSERGIPLVIGGKALEGETQKKGYNPSNPQQSLYSYALAEENEIEEALKTAKQAYEKWKSTSIDERSHLLALAAQKLREGRSELIGVMMADTAKTIVESDVEISEAIDFLDYYRFNVKEMDQIKDIQWHPKGVVLVAPPWNFPCSIPAGGIAAALAAGNCVIFKPAPEAVWVGWTLVQMFWEAGFSKEVLQFVNCEDEPYGSQLVKDPRLSTVVLTGATSTAKHFLRMRPDLDLIAETGGKNAIIVSNLADRDQAVKDIVQSAFGHAGQKCSACSLVICLGEVYDDPHFRRQLNDAAASLSVGVPWKPETRLNPLIRPPQETLIRGLTRLEEGEEWLLKPKPDPHNPCLWTPGIKLGVRPGSFTQKNELFGPVLGLMWADTLEQAINMANQSNYGLTSGLHSLDVREQGYWADRIEAGNCYINRGITGAIVQRQPFGGWKDSCFSPGAKAGGPNYVMQLMRAEQKGFPKERAEPSKEVLEIEKWLKMLQPEQQEKWKAGAGSYAYYWQNCFSKKHDPSLVLGEDNFLRYLPRKNLQIRLNDQDSPLEVLCALAAAKTCGAKITISSPNKLPFKMKELIMETDKEFVSRLSKRFAKRIRFFSEPDPKLRKELIELGCYTQVSPLLINGRIELLHYLREQSLTISYHRYGNLGEREK